MGADFVSYSSATSFACSSPKPILPIHSSIFLRNLVKIFPGLATRPLLLTGESYAGTYIVTPLSYSRVNWLMTLRMTAIHHKDHIFYSRATCEANEDCHWKRCDGLSDRNRYPSYRAFLSLCLWPPDLQQIICSLVSSRPTHS